MSGRRSSVLKNLLLFLGLAIFLFMGVAPLIEAYLPYDTKAARWLEWSRSRLMEFLIAAWFAALGAMVGSFINVVVWRMPRGVSVVAKGSACPRCRSKIRLKDNIPIFGWLKLGGRCRVCKLPISARYPIVETIFGAVFLILFLVQLRTAGFNLPGGTEHRSTGILQVIISTKWDVIGTWAYHTTLMVMLLIWALMAYDGSRLPIKTLVFSLLVGVVAAVATGYVQPESWISNHEQWFTSLPVLHPIATAFLGLAAGFLIGEFVETTLGRKNTASEFATAFDNEKAGIGLTFGFVSIGVFLGWQSVGQVTLLFGLMIAMRRVVGSLYHFVPAAGLLALATLLHLCTWRLSSELGRWLSEASGLPNVVVEFVKLGLAAALVFLMSARYPFQPLPSSSYIEEMPVPDQIDYVDEAEQAEDVDEIAVDGHNSID